MQLNNNIFCKDIKEVCSADFIPWNNLKHRTIFLSGATGLIGSGIINALSYANQKKELDLTIIALVRNQEKAEKKFSKQLECGFLKLVTSTVENLPPIEDSIDYIIHGASQTASKDFVNYPVETIYTSILGTQKMLELAKSKHPLGFIYLSSMEVYGFPPKGRKIKEKDIGAINPLDLRNSYPLSKQMCEALCCAYVKEYQIPATIIRLTQTFGPEIHDNDNRIFAYCVRCLCEKKDIILKTRGETERSYLHTRDAVTAILTVLLKGTPGQAYNAADENTYCSIAEIVAKIAKSGGVKLLFDIQKESENGFPQTLYMDLDTSLLRKLDWRPLT